MLVYIVIGISVAVAAAVLMFFVRPMIPRSSKQHVNRRELRRIEIEYGQKKDSGR
jgi:MFS superfamily sulfate permease-like transporter